MSWLGKLLFLLFCANKTLQPVELCQYAVFICISWAWAWTVIIIVIIIDTTSNTLITATGVRNLGLKLGQSSSKLLQTTCPYLKTLQIIKIPKRNVMVQQNHQNQNSLFSSLFILYIKKLCFRCVLTWWRQTLFWGGKIITKMVDFRNVK